MLKGPNTGKFWLLLVVLIGAGVFINFFEQIGEARIPRRSLTEMPAQLGEWRQSGADERFSAEIESVLRADDYVMRNYAMPGAGSSSSSRRANLYIGYYLSQKTGATYHSPLNCLPGSGWVMRSPQKLDIKTPAGKTFQANAYIIESDKYKEVLIYWYHGRGRAVADEFQDKIYTIWDSLLRRRSDGSMVRVMTSVGDSEEKAVNAAIDLAGRAADEISDYVPD
jgi:EpsI family protein